MLRIALIVLMGVALSFGKEEKKSTPAFNPKLGVGGFLQMGKDSKGGIHARIPFTSSTSLNGWLSFDWGKDFLGFGASYLWHYNTIFKSRAPGLRLDYGPVLGLGVQGDAQSAQLGAQGGVNYSFGRSGFDIFLLFEPFIRFVFDEEDDQEGGLLAKLGLRYNF